jgi:DNA-binding HxlR family transcriptional regulator
MKVKQQNIKGVSVKLRPNCTCPLELTHDMIRGKWKSIILWRLRLKPTSLADLTRDIEGITPKMLLEHLKELMECGFVQKKSFNGYPLHVEYSLTPDKGQRILEALGILQQLGIDFMRENGMEDILKEKGLI